MNITSSIRESASALYNNPSLQRGASIAFSHISRVPIVGPLAVGGTLTLLGIAGVWKESRLTSDEPRSYRRPITLLVVGGALVGVSLLSISGLFSRAVSAPMPNAPQGEAMKALNLDLATNTLDTVASPNGAMEPLLSANQTVVASIQQGIIPDAATHCFIENRTFELANSVDVTEVFFEKTVETVVPKLPDAATHCFIENRTLEIEKTVSSMPLFCEKPLEILPQIEKRVFPLPEVPTNLWGWAKKFFTG